MAKSGEVRRKQILRILSESAEPVSGAELAAALEVSRQVIVQDIALLRAAGAALISTSRGYMLSQEQEYSRVFKVIHSNDQLEEELNLFVDHGARVQDVFVYHKVYGVIRAALNIKSRWDVQKYIRDISGGKSTTLMKLTSNYHYHTVTASTPEALDFIQQELDRKGFLAKLQDYEPVDFWSEEK